MAQTISKSQKKKEKQRQKQQQAPQPQLTQPYLIPKKGKGQGTGGKGKKGNNDGKMACWYCNSTEHLYQNCPKWVSDGKPEIKKQKCGK